MAKKSNLKAPSNSDFKRDINKHWTFAKYIGASLGLLFVLSYVTPVVFASSEVDTSLDHDYSDATLMQFNCDASECDTSEFWQSAPEYIRAGVHPGLFFGKNKIASTFDFYKGIINGIVKIENLVNLSYVETKEVHPELYAEIVKKGLEAEFRKEATKKAYQVATSMYKDFSGNKPGVPIAKYIDKLGKWVAKCYYIDQNSMEESVYDRFNHDRTWDWVETNILKNEKCLEDYTKHEFLDLFETLNRNLLPHQHGDSDTSLLRKENTAINKVSDFPGFLDPWVSRAYLREHSPEALPVFNRLLSRVQKYRSSASWDTGQRLFAHLHEKASEEEVAFLNRYIAIAVDYKTLPERLATLAVRLPKLIRQDPIKAAACAHMQFVTLHPYEDANGREARMLMNIILAQNGYQMVNFYRNKEYMAALNKAIDGNDDKIFEDYLTKTMRQQRHAMSEQVSMNKSVTACEDECGTDLLECDDRCQAVFNDAFENFEQKGFEI